MVVFYYLAWEKLFPRLRALTAGRNGGYSHDDIAMQYLECFSSELWFGVALLDQPISILAENLGEACHTRWEGIPSSGTRSVADTERQRCQQAMPLGKGIICT